MLGIELELPIRIKTGPGMTTDSDSIPSLDRLDSTRGYVRGNVAVISWRANKLKNSARVEELERIAAWMRARGAT